MSERLVAGVLKGLGRDFFAEALGVPASTLSFHLKELKFAGVVSCRRDGRSLIYNANFAAMAALVESPFTTVRWAQP